MSDAQTFGRDARMMAKNEVDIAVEFWGFCLLLLLVVLGKCQTSLVAHEMYMSILCHGAKFILLSVIKFLF